MPKRLMCFGSSTTWGFKPGSFDPVTTLGQRYGEDERWTCLVGKALPHCTLIEEGLNGRTTMFDDRLAGKPYRNGLAHLPMCLETHYPLDLVIFMLGTNDVKLQYHQSPEAIAAGMLKLVQCVTKSNRGPNGLPPKVLLIAPAPPIKEGLDFAYFNEASIEKSKALIPLYAKIAKEEGCFFLDASEYVTASPLDGIHLDAAGHRKFAEVVKQKIEEIE